MRTEAIRALWLAACLCSAAGCGLDVVEIEVVETGQVGLTALRFPGMDSFGSSLGRALSDKDVDPSDVDSMRVTAVHIRMLSQGGLTDDLSFVEDLALTAAAEELDAARLAHKESFAEGVREADLEIDAQTELKPFLEAGGMRVEVGARLNPPPPDLVELELAVKLRVDVNL
ncbi:MAG: hypothetical protein JXR96_23105 [Deltaproteobacteria bacterium]|nr:hypothetical protein [Deltaproteobacteria bacterium]